MADVEHYALEGYRERNRLSLGIRTLPSLRGALMPMRILGTGGLGLIELGKRSIRKAYLEDDMPMYAAALGFRAFFALIPFLVFVVASLGVLQIPGFFDWLLGKAQNILAKETLEEAKLVLEQVRHQAQGGSLAFAAIAVALWYTSLAVRSLMTALDVAFDVEERRPARRRYPLSIILAVGFSAAIALAGTLMLVGTPVMRRLLSRVGMNEDFASVWGWLRWPAAVLLLMAVVALAYYLFPNDEEPFRFVTPGAVLAVTVWLVTSAGLRYYVLNFANYSVMFGAMGAVMLLLLFFYVSAGVLLLGAEVNAVIRNASGGDKSALPHKTGEMRQDAGGTESTS
jgi:membrane protein